MHAYVVLLLHVQLFVLSAICVASHESAYLESLISAYKHMMPQCFLGQGSFGTLVLGEPG